MRSDPNLKQSFESLFTLIPTMSGNWKEVTSNQKKELGAIYTHIKSYGENKTLHLTDEIKKAIESLNLQKTNLNAVSSKIDAWLEVMKDQPSKLWNKTRRQTRSDFFTTFNKLLKKYIQSLPEDRKGSIVEEPTTAALMTKEDRLRLGAEIVDLKAQIDDLKAKLSTESSLDPVSNFLERVDFIRNLAYIKTYLFLLISEKSEKEAALDSGKITPEQKDQTDERELRVVELPNEIQSVGEEDQFSSVEVGEERLQDKSLRLLELLKQYANVCYDPEGLYTQAVKVLKPYLQPQDEFSRLINSIKETLENNTHPAARRLKRKLKELYTTYTLIPLKERAENIKEFALELIDIVAKKDNIFNYELAKQHLDVIFKTLHIFPPEDEFSRTALANIYNLVFVNTAEILSSNDHNDEKKEAANSLLTLLLHIYVAYRLEPEEKHTDDYIEKIATQVQKIISKKYRIIFSEETANQLLTGVNQKFSPYLPKPESEEVLSLANDSQQDEVADCFAPTPQQIETLAQAIRAYLNQSFGFFAVLTFFAQNKDFYTNFEKSKEEQQVGLISNMSLDRQTLEKLKNTIINLENNSNNGGVDVYNFLIRLKCPLQNYLKKCDDFSEYINSEILKVEDDTAEARAYTAPNPENTTESVRKKNEKKEASFALLKELKDTKNQYLNIPKDNRNANHQNQTLIEISNASAKHLPALSYDRDWRAVRTACRLFILPLFNVVFGVTIIFPAIKYFLAPKETRRAQSAFFSLCSKSQSSVEDLKSRVDMMKGSIPLIPGKA